MESDDFTRHYIISYLSARELVLPPLSSDIQLLIAYHKSVFNMQPVFTQPALSGFIIQAWVV